MLLPNNDPVNQPPFALHIGWYGNILGLLTSWYATPLGTPTVSLADSGQVSLAETQLLFSSFAMPQSESADNVKQDATTY